MDHALVNSHAYKLLLQAQPLPGAQSLAAHADDALQPSWGGAAQPWLPDPAALARPHWQMPQPFCGMSGQSPAYEAAISDRPPLRPVSACSTPAAVTPPAFSHGALVKLQPDATAHDSACVGAIEHRHDHGRSANGLTAGLLYSPAPQPESGNTWQAQPAPSCPPGPSAHHAVHPEGSSAGHGLPACGAEQSAAGRHLMHQPSFAAWVPLDRLTGCESAPMGVPAIGVSSPYCLGPPSTDQLSAGQALTAQHSGALGLSLAQQGSQDLYTPGAFQPQIGHPTQQMQQPSHSQQPYQQMQLRQAGDRGLLSASGASLMGNEDSLCAFLGGWQSAGPVQQHKSGLSRHSEPRHAAGPSSHSSLVPVSAPGGRLMAEMPCSSQLQPPRAADEVQAAPAQAVLPQTSPVAVPAQGHPDPRHGSHAAAATEMLEPQSEARMLASRPGVPAAAAAEQLMHAEGEEFWRSLLSVVKDYKGKYRRGQGCIRFACDNLLLDLPCGCLC